MLKKIRLVNYSISISDNEVLFNPIKSNVIKGARGFDLYLYEDECYKVFIQGANLKEEIILKLITVLENDFKKNIKHLYTFLK